jgi:integrase
VARNVVREPRSSRRRGKERRADPRQKGKLKVGIDIPAPEEIKAIIEAAGGRRRPLFLTAIFTVLRASEMRGVRWADVDLKKGELSDRHEDQLPQALDRHAQPVARIHAGRLRQSGRVPLLDIKRRG